MSNRGFPTASAFLEMQERRRQYRKHIDALRSCKHMIDDSQPIPPAYLVNRRTRQTKIQMYIMRTGEENIRLISRYNESRNKNKKSSSQLRAKSYRPNWVNEMYNSMAFSNNSYANTSQGSKSQKLPPLNSYENEEEIQKDEKQEEAVEEQNTTNDNVENENNDIKEEVVDQNENKTENEEENQNEDENQNENKTENEEEEKEIKTENQEEENQTGNNEEENQNETKIENQEEENQNETKIENQEEENQNEIAKENQEIDENNKQTDSIENGEDNNTVDTTLGEAGEKGRLNVMLDALNGLVD